MSWLRGNVTPILLVCLLVVAVLIWRALVRIEDDYYTCGSHGHPCRVIVVPDR